MHFYSKKTAITIFIFLIFILSFASSSFADDPALQDLATDPANASASSQHRDRGPARAFDNLNTHYFVDAWEAEGKTGWLKYDFGKGNEKVVKEYSITGANFPTSSPKAWTFECSSDNENWTILNKVTNEPIFDNFEKRTYTISNTNQYQYYRINVTENHGDGWMIIGELELLGNIDPPPPINRVLLVITLVSGVEKEYDLSRADFNNFVIWYSTRALGTGAEVYTINKDFNKANFLTRKDYLAFSKIELYEVNEYTPVP
ncbi:discoidin domain-containing protein [Paenibacillus sp. WQ 127069]|uniref:Discoidin domain-containing protein n=1 Tax=Paenibacillus baimaensis TaxID=2982185 RepID=A0ABT2UM33_9BACL|nr:discoidin domain-containing protein [Paenibacillus sp. WQ 127069]MCU6795141.1 discoidin domain-containing protein [Paenibacillus sp. WQ 127069]